MNSLVLIGSGCLVCLMPLALYLLFLAYLNQRSRATIMNGAWDFGCALLGLSGFILVGGPVLLAVLDSSWRSNFFAPNANHFKAAMTGSGLVWSMIVGGYVLALGSGTVLLVYSRRRITVVYNCDPDNLEEMLIAALKSLGLTWRRALGGIEISSAHKPPALAANEGPKGPDTVETPPRREGALPAASYSGAFVQIDVFAALHYGSIVWRDEDPMLRREVERQLEKAYRTAESPANPAAGWFMTAAVAIFFTMLLWLIFLIYQMMAVKGR